MIDLSTLQFLKAIRKNNNKEWLDAHRKEYETAKANFAAFVQQVILQLAKKDPTIKHLTPKDCIFRFNRDIRFSKNKDPYKTNFGASINLGGKKAMHTAGYYFHLEPGLSFTGGGIYMPDGETVKKIRQEIDYNFADFKKIINTASFKKVYGDLSRSEEYSLKKTPKDYEADNPAADYLKLKSWIASKEVSDKEILDKNLVNNTVAHLSALQPLISFINAGTHTE